MKEKNVVKLLGYLFSNLVYGCISERTLSVSTFDDSKSYVVVNLKPFRNFSSLETCFIREQVLESDYIKKHLPHVHLKHLVLLSDCIKAVYIVI